MPPSLLLRIAAAAGFLGVGLGAFGAHLLQAKLALLGTAATWQTAVLYHLIHAAVLLALSRGPAVSRWIAWLFIAGIVLFSGSLYLYALLKLKPLAMITPLGGLCFLAGWAALAFRRPS